MNPNQPKDKFSELRLLLAALLCMVVVIVWTKYFGPKPPLNPTQGPQATPSAPATPGTTPSNASAKSDHTSPAAGTPSAARAAPAPATPPKSAQEERSVVVENDLYRVEFSNRGAVVKSWQLKKYKDDSNPPQTLDLVHPKVSEQTGGWPMAVVLDNADWEKAANGGLYETSAASGNLRAPADLEFSWSDGHLAVTKRFHFDHTYVVRIETSVTVDGKPVHAGIAWLGGFGDLTVTNPIPIETVEIFYAENGKITVIPHKKLETIEKWPPGIWQGGKDFTGVEDRYFAAAFLPPNGSAPQSLQTRYWKGAYSYKQDNQDKTEDVPQVATAQPELQQPLNLRLYVGPKDYDDLKKMNPPLQGLVNFGWLEFIADPLFHLLKWIHGWVPNWGWAIVVLTLALNMVLFPLRISSYRTTLKMQRVAPEIKAIQDRYKKYSMRDPRKAEMNKEVMAVYQREGVNPVGGCIPQLLQFPIWFGLYRALQGTIELRHAPWFWWIRDLSAKDPYYILPVLMGVSMYFSSKMTPMTSADPQQQAMMKFMPISMAALFIVIPYPSGLAVYILTSGLVGILQQWYLNKKHPMPAPAKVVRGKQNRKV